MRRRPQGFLVPLAMLCLALALPAAAGAQSAGDNQYVDPFEGQKPPANRPQAGGSPGTNGQATGAPSPSASSSQPAAGDSAAASTATGDAAREGEQLPRTGVGLLMMLAGGVALVGAGVTLRLAIDARPS